MPSLSSRATPLPDSTLSVPPAGPSWLPSNPVLRRLTLMIMDGLLLAAGLALNFVIWLRFREGSVPDEYTRLFAHVVVPIVLLRILLFQGFGLYRSISRRTGNYDLMVIALADSIASALIVIFNFLTPLISGLGPYYPLHSSAEHILRIPWGIVFNDWMVALIAIGGIRLLRREVGLSLLRRKSGPWKRVLIVGAGDTGDQVARDLVMSTQGAYRPVAYVDPDPSLVGLKIQGLPVAGSLDDLPKVIEKYRPDDIVIALQRPAPRLLSQIVEHCRSARLGFRIVPPLTSVMAGRIEVSTLRNVEIEDLLDRAPVDFAEDGSADFLKGKRILVTGAGGSIGRELCRQALLQRPQSINLLGRGENSLFEALIELGPLAKEFDVELETIIGDVCDEPMMQKLLDRVRPHVVFHAAAHKHVHFMEAQPSEAVKNNVRGTLVVARAAAALGAPDTDWTGVEHFIFISTDKAVRPSSVMGASKRVAEMVVSGINEQAKGSFVSVRFGNVLGSRGSVVPTFRRQIEQGGPVTVTHPDATRYFMTTSEAVSLVIQAARLSSDQAGHGGAELFVLDMGRPVRIADLARNLITLSGLEPETDIPIVFTGLRPGEKLTEDLLTQEEGTTATEHGKIFIARRETRSWDDLEVSLNRLFRAAGENDEATIRSIFKELIPDFA